jgi:hypothetical protein
MITFTNYNQATKEIDWSILPEVFKRTHNELIPEAQKGAYKNDADVKRVVDSYISKLNTALAKAPGKKSQKKEHPRYKIQWFNSKAKPQRTEDKVFVGENAYEDAVTWGRKTLENFNTDLINSTDDYPSVAQMTEKKETSSTKTKTVKPAAKKSNEQSSSKKSAKLVERIDDEITLIKRFIAMHNKTKTRDQVMNVLRAVQKAMIEKRVTKNSMYGPEVDQIQKSLIGVVNEPAKMYDLKIDPKRLERYIEISGSVEKMLSVALLKRYIGLEGKRGEGVYEKALRLRKDILRAIEIGKVTRNDKYYSQLLHAERNIERSPRSPYVSTVQLNGIREIWTGTKNIANKIASGANKVATGTKKMYQKAKPVVEKIHAKTKTVVAAGRSEIKKVSTGTKILAAGTKAIFVRKKDPRYSARVLILKAYPEGDFRIKFLTLPKNSGWSVGEEDKDIEKSDLVPATEKNLGSIPEMIAAAAGALVQKHVHKHVEKLIVKPHLSGPGIMDLDQLKNQHFEKIGLLGEWKQLIGDACKPTSIFIYGRGGSGKSTMAYKLCEILNNLGNKILYVAAEQYGTPALRDLLLRLDLKIDKETFPIVRDLKQLDPADFDFVVLDSKDACGFTHSDQFEAFKRKYPKQSFIITTEGTKGGSFSGDEGWRNKVDTMILCENYIAKTDTDKNRWGGKGQMKLS